VQACIHALHQWPSGHLPRYIPHRQTDRRRGSGRGMLHSSIDVIEPTHRQTERPPCTHSMHMAPTDRPRSSWYSVVHLPVTSSAAFLAPSPQYQLLAHSHLVPKLHACDAQTLQRLHSSTWHRGSRISVAFAPLHTADSCCN